MINQAYREKNKRASVGPYIYVQPLSSDLLAVYVDKEANAVIAYRGTDPTNRDDLLADAQIVAGTYPGSPRDRLVEKQTQVALQGLGDARSVLFTGHSLGGRSSWEVFYRRRKNKKYKWRGYNSAPLGTNYYWSDAGRRIEGLRTTLDPVSAPDIFARATRTVEGIGHGLAEFTKPTEK